MKDITIRLRIDGATREKLDEDRGSLSISEYIRGLIGGDSVATNTGDSVEGVATNEWEGPQFKDSKLKFTLKKNINRRIWITNGINLLEC